MEDSGTTTLWPEHHQTVLNQCKEGGPTIKGFTVGKTYGKHSFVSHTKTHNRIKLIYFINER